jgi:hypothetical protein
MHVDQVMARIPVDDRCTCKPAPARNSTPRRRGLFRR